VSLNLPSIATAADVGMALGLVAEAVGSGDLTPEEGASVAAVLEVKRKAIERQIESLSMRERHARPRPMRTLEL
jgi:hypothetical protein